MMEHGINKTNVNSPFSTEITKRTKPLCSDIMQFDKSLFFHMKVCYLFVTLLPI